MILRFAQHNLWYKLAALAIAMLVWSHMRTVRNPVEKKILEVPVTFVNYPPTLALVRSTPSVRFIIRGHREEIERLRSSDVRAQVDLAAASAGTHGMGISCVLPSWVDVRDVRMEPPVATVELEELLSKSFDVHVNVIGEPASGYTAGQPTVDPGKATISGRSGLLENVRVVFAKVNLSDAISPVDGEVEAIPVDRMGVRVADLAADPPRVRVRIPVSQTESSREVPVTAQIRGKPSAGYEVEEVTVAPQTVRATGHPAKLRSLRSLLTEEIDITGATATTSRQVALQIPDAVVVPDSRVRVIVALRRLPPAAPPPKETPPPAPEGGH